MSMPVKKAFNIRHISQRASAYGISGVTIDGNDVLAVYDAIRAVATKARNGEGPSLVEALTYRWKGHSKSDRQAYRTRNEVKEWQERDPIQHLARLLNLSEAEHKQIIERARSVIEEAVAFANACPEPNLNTIMEGVYA